MRDNTARTDQNDRVIAGEQAYNEWQASLVSTPEKRAIYEEEAREFEKALEIEEARLSRKQSRATRVNSSGSTRAPNPLYARGRDPE